MAVCQNERSDLNAAERAAVEARTKKLDKLRDAMKRDGVMDEIAKNGGIGSALETLHQIMRGSNKLLRDSIESNWHSKRDGWLAALNNSLYKAGLKKVAEGGLDDKDVAVAWYKLSNREDPGKGPAAARAKLYNQALDSMRDMQNAAGAHIGDARDYVTTTQWDPVRMRRAAGSAKTQDEAFEAWWAKDRPRMSPKTFEGISPKPGQSIEDAHKEFGRSLFDAFLSGVYTKFGTAENGYIPAEFEGTHNVGAKVAAHRSIIWKDGEAWHQHMQDFGTSSTLHAAVTNSIDRGARALALLDKLGNNPQANLKLLSRRIEETYMNNGDAIHKLRSGMRSVLNEMRDLDGTLNIPSSMGLERFTSSVMQVENMASLGGVGITHFASIWPTVTSELAHHGINRLESLGNMLRALGTGMGDQERRDMLADIGAYADGALRHVNRKLGDDTIPGKISSWASHFMDATGIHVLFDRTKAGIRDMLAHNLGRNVDKAWGNLDPHLTDMLSRYRIGPDDWNLLKEIDGVPSYNGRVYLTPSSVREGLKDESVEQLLQKRGQLNDGPFDKERAIANYRQNLADKILSYYSDGAAHGVVTPGVREKAFLLQGTQKGTPANTAGRFFTQFKMWPVAAMNQILEREIYVSLSKSEAAWNIGKLVALGVPAGYIRMVISDYARGHPLRDPTKPETLLAAAAQSGGLGIFGDFLFGETSRMGAGLVTTAMGPVISDADQLEQMFNRAKGDVTPGGPVHRNGGQFGDIWPELSRFAVRHIPFANLVYLKGALDYLLFYHLYEATSPGWWARSNRRLLKEQGRAMTGYMPGQGVPWGVPGVYLTNNQGESTGVLGNQKLQTTQ